MFVVKMLLLFGLFSFLVAVVFGYRTWKVGHEIKEAFMQDASVPKSKRNKNEEDEMKGEENNEEWME